MVDFGWVGRHYRQRSSRGIEAARERARAEHTTLNEQFRRWLADYAHRRERMQRYDEVMATLRSSLKVGRKLTRDQMNER